MKTAVLLVNMGTPSSPTPHGVRQFLRPFLSDRRVVDLPPMFWLPILYCIILPLRSGRVAKLYQSIWTTGGSPLLVITKLQAAALQTLLSQRLLAFNANKRSESDKLANDHLVDESNVTTDIVVSFAMTYTQPSIAMEIKRLSTEEKADRVIVIPLFPQYSTTTTGAIYSQISTLMLNAVHVPDIRIVHDYYRRKDFIVALADSVRKHRAENGVGQMLLFSYHGIPKACTTKGDPYERHCNETAVAVAKELGLTKGTEWRVSFQSRFGKAEWLKPYTDDLLSELPTQHNVFSVDVICPAFAADCLETLEEIEECSRHVFTSAGGKKFTLVPCLNATDAHIKMMAGIAMDEMHF